MWSYLGRVLLCWRWNCFTKDVKPYALVVGNPSRQIGWMSEYGHRLEFDESNIAVCPESGHKYRFENDNVTRID